MIANGVSLDTYAYNIRTRTGRYNTPARRGKNVEVPARHGAIFTPGKKFGPQAVALPMWVIGADEDGNVPRDGTTRELFETNLTRLLRIFTADTVELIDDMHDGTSRRIVGQVLDVIAPDLDAGGTRAELGISLQCAAAFWEDVEERSATRTGTGLWLPVEFRDASAPMDDLTVRFAAPCTNPQVTNINGVYVAYNAALSGTHWVEINCADWTVTGGGGLTASYSAIDHQGDPRWFVLEPGDPTPECTFSQTAGTTGTVTLTGRRKHAIG
jgi:hypothetical protein